jgi:peroxisomal coenzyme A diphosphatase NUDT7
LNNITIIKSAILESTHPDPPEQGKFQPTGVMVLLLPEPEIRLLFILKADIEGYPWANQMAFPGGHKDKEDKTTKDTAIRELSEELRIKKENVEIIGSLGHFQTINNKDIEAWAGIWNMKDQIRHDPSEIASVYKIPLQHLISTHKEKNFHKRMFNYMELIYPYEDVVIWGVTAKIVHHLLESLIMYQLRISALLLSSCQKKQETEEGQLGCGFPALEL